MQDEKTAFVLGSIGMLGSTVRDYLALNNWHVIEYNRSKNGNLIDFLRSINNSEHNYVFNCIGAIPQKTLDPERLYCANLQVVIEIIRNLGPQVRLIQPSTDCVFSGNKKEPYTKNDPDVSLDHYGISKRAAELFVVQRPNSYVIRTSIIGMGHNCKGLLNWILQNENETVDGFIDHYWNGITTLEWCKQAISILADSHQCQGQLYQLGTRKSITKANLITLVSDIFNLNITVKPVKRQFRSLILQTDRPVISLDDQLRELKIWQNQQSPR